MAVLDIFSKRQRRLRGEVPDVYCYDSLPSALRVQIVHICRDTLGDGYEGQSPRAYELIVEALCREYGVFMLPPTQTRARTGYADELAAFILGAPDVEHVLDAVEIAFRVIDNSTRSYGFLLRADAAERADAAIQELNARLKEHGIGFEFSNQSIIRIDSEFMHSEVVKPALAVLSGKRFSGAEQEFLSAHSHYRSSKYKECLNDCLKALESTMKVICDGRGWSYKMGATAKDLIQACLDNNLIPAFWQQHFSSLRAGLESGVPTGRNKLGGHGQGATPVEVPGHIAAYMLHMTAAAIVFLSEADASLP